MGSWKPSGGQLGALEPLGAGALRTLCTPEPSLAHTRTGPLQLEPGSRQLIWA